MLRCFQPVSAYSVVAEANTISKDERDLPDR